VFYQIQNILELFLLHQVTALVLVKTSNGITKDKVIQRVKQFGDLAYHVHYMERTSVAALIIKKLLDDHGH
jgi:hypothetical protein